MTNADFDIITFPNVSTIRSVIINGMSESSIAYLHTYATAHRSHRNIFLTFNNIKALTVIARENDSPTIIMELAGKDGMSDTCVSVSDATSISIVFHEALQAVNTFTNILDTNTKERFEGIAPSDFVYTNKDGDFALSLMNVLAWGIRDSDTKIHLCREGGPAINICSPLLEVESVVKGY